jgi:glycosyltransferase involved in cell wall biosynthesis
MPPTASSAKQAPTTDTPQIEDATLVCFSHLRWDFVYQRPQHPVVVIEEPIFEDVPEPELRRSSRGEGVTVCVPVLPHGLSESGKILAQRQLVEKMLAELPTSRRLFWYYTPMALLFTRHLDADVVIFDSMDELSAFKGAPPELRALEDEMMQKADVVFTGGHSLYEAKKHRHENIHAFPSSIDAAHFGKGRAEDREDPEDQAAIPRPRLGFFGVIDERMDIDLVRDVAALRPDWQFVMIGPVVKIDEADLPRAENIHWLGGRSYQELPRYIGGWDVGFMPFARNESTQFISPTKTPEFLAAGVPTVSTPIVDVIRSYGDDGYVAIAEDAESVVKSVEELMATDRGPWIKRVDEKLADGSWDQTFERIYELVTEAHDGRSSRNEGAQTGKDNLRV